MREALTIPIGVAPKNPTITQNQALFRAINARRYRNYIKRQRTARLRRCLPLMIRFDAWRKERKRQKREGVLRDSPL
jgi:hypothetical protein